MLNELQWYYKLEMFVKFIDNGEFIRNLEVASHLHEFRISSKHKYCVIYAVWNVWQTSYSVTFSVKALENVTHYSEKSLYNVYNGIDKKLRYLNIITVFQSMIRGNIAHILMVWKYDGFRKFTIMSRKENKKSMGASDWWHISSDCTHLIYRLEQNIYSIMKLFALS